MAEAVADISQVDSAVPTGMAGMLAARLSRNVQKKPLLLRHHFIEALVRLSMEIWPEIKEPGMVY